MKDFIKGRWFPLVAVLAAVLLIALILFICGFRITYAPELENSWDAVSAVAAWGGVFASFIAIWFAIQVPRKIAKEQNRIALFEKRHDAYSAFLTLEVFAKSLDQETFQDGAKDQNGNIISTEYKVGLCCAQFAGVFGYFPKASKSHSVFENLTQTLSILKQYEIRTMALAFLFSTTDEEKAEMWKGLSLIIEPLLCFMTEISTYDINSKINDTNRRDFITALRKFKEKYSKKLDHELKI